MSDLTNARVAVPTNESEPARVCASSCEFEIKSLRVQCSPISSSCKVRLYFPRNIGIGMQSLSRELLQLAHAREIKNISAEMSRSTRQVQVWMAK
jgi:hypothetical protein